MTPASGARPSARGASPHHREATYVAVIAILGVLLFSSLLQSTYDSRGGSNSSILRHIEIEHNQDQQAQDSPDHQHENPLRDQSDSGTADTEYEPAKRSSAELCSTEFPWIELVVKKWFEPAYASARRSKQSSADALQAIKNITWGKYHPGIEEVRLLYNPRTHVADMVVTRVTTPNQPWKPVGMLAVLRKAVAAHTTALASALKAVPGREVRLLLETEDFPLVHRTNNWKLPAFAMCASPDHIDIPVPDFTFDTYPEAGYSNSSWAAVGGLLGLKGRLVPWKVKSSHMFMRHHKGVGYRKTLMPVLEKLQEQGKAEEALGVPLDIADTGFVLSNKEHFVLLDDWCNRRYLLHTSGFAYSASLKYKMACGSVIFNFVSPQWHEFFYPALNSGEHFIAFQEVNEANLTNSILPQIKAHVKKFEESGDEEPLVARNAHDWVTTNLSPDALNCYWYRVLLAYIKLYAAQDPANIPQHP